MQKIIQLLTDPVVATPFWGAIGGAIAAMFRGNISPLGLLTSVVIAVLISHLFTPPLTHWVGIPSAREGISALLGITSYELVRVLATGEFLTYLKAGTPNFIKKD